MKLLLFAMMMGLSVWNLVLVGETSREPETALAFIELRDRFDVLHRVTFPTTNAVVVILADKDGAGEVEGWLAELKPKCAGRAQLLGVASFEDPPAFFRSRIAKKFRTTRTHSVLMDWSGTVTRQFGARPGVASVVVVSGHGTILGRSAGRASELAVQRVMKCLEQALGPGPHPGAPRPSNVAD